MNRKFVGTFVLLCAIALTSSCYSGPKRFQRTWDDYENRAYVENAWMSGILGVVPVYPFVMWVAMIGDAFYNFYYFWFKDAFDDNTGTAFIQENPGGARKSVSGPGF